MLVSENPCSTVCSYFNICCYFKSD
uniref:Uncharacterized protein n=1 Tax=Anguilla anguilla TaxID=7936 RepID=A0A0E9V324_ANGAN